MGVALQLLREASSPQSHHGLREVSNLVAHSYKSASFPLRACPPAGGPEAPGDGRPNVAVPALLCTAPAVLSLRHPQLPASQVSSPVQCVSRQGALHGSMMRTPDIASEGAMMIFWVSSRVSH